MSTSDEIIPLWKSPLADIAALAAVAVAVCLIGAVAVWAYNEQEVADREVAAELDRFAGSVVTKICNDGTRIYRLRGGEYMAGGLAPRPVENPETVCQSR